MSLLELEKRGHVAILTLNRPESMNALGAPGDGDQVAEACETLAVPVNSLHARGFLSIGCEPCTRAVQPGEPERAGRWWWENDEARECGLHLDSDGRLVRAKVAA